MTSPDLGQRLIDAASDAFDVGHYDFGPVVANVLRTLALAEARDVAKRLQALADAIERGDSDG